MTKKIYLCGPIMDCAIGDAKDWRTRAKERLAGRFILLDPLRRSFRDNEVDSSNEIVEFYRHACFLRTTIGAATMTRIAA